MECGAGALAARKAGAQVCRNVFREQQIVPLWAVGQGWRAAAGDQGGVCWSQPAGTLSSAGSPGGSPSDFSREAGNTGFYVKSPCF